MFQNVFLSHSLLPLLPGSPMPLLLGDRPPSRSTRSPVVLTSPPAAAVLLLLPTWFFCRSLLNTGAGPPPNGFIVTCNNCCNTHYRYEKQISSWFEDEWGEGWCHYKYHPYSHTNDLKFDDSSFTSLSTVKCRLRDLTPNYHNTCHQGFLSFSVPVYKVFYSDLFSYWLQGCPVK